MRWCRYRLRLILLAAAVDMLNVKWCRWTLLSGVSSKWSINYNCMQNRKRKSSRLVDLLLQVETASVRQEGNERHCRQMFGWREGTSGRSFGSFSDCCAQKLSRRRLTLLHCAVQPVIRIICYTLILSSNKKFPRISITCDSMSTNSGLPAFSQSVKKIGRKVTLH